MRNTGSEDFGLDAVAEAGGSTRGVVLAVLATIRAVDLDALSHAP